MIPKTVLELLDVDGSTNVTPSALLSYADVQEHLKLDGSADQTLVQTIITAATRRLEAYTGRKFMRQHWSIYYDNFPQLYKDSAWWDGSKDGAVSELYDASENPIELPFGPCMSVTFVRAYDRTDGSVVMDSSTYQLDSVGPVGRIALRSGSTWPTTTLRALNGVHIRGIFGMGTAASVISDEIKHAAKITVAAMYENRGDTSDGKIPSLAQTLLEPFKLWRLR